ncbi:hypothetical protein JCM5296_003100 [Sporobolomyces johnsonii]
MSASSYSSACTSLSQPPFPPSSSSSAPAPASTASSSSGSTPPTRSSTSTPTGPVLSAATSMDSSTTARALDSFGHDAIRRDAYSVAGLAHVLEPRRDPVDPGAQGPASWVDKGKRVARDGGEQDGQRTSLSSEDEQERQKRVDKVLKRAEAAKLARAFRNRLALASFKTSRGWQDVKLDVIEPHLEQEAFKRKQHGDMPSPQLQLQQPPAQPQPPPLMAQPPSAYPHPPQPQYSQPHQYVPHHHLSQQPYKPYQYQYGANAGSSMDGMLGGGPAYKRSRSASGQNGTSVYAPQPQPHHQLSPYSTANVYQTTPAVSAPSQLDGRGSKKRALEGAGAAPTPRQRTRSSGGGSRRGTPKQQQQPLSSSDPNFSSFVDAAAALTGMARAPSDPSVGGSDEERQLQQPPQRHYPTQPGPGPSQPPHFPQPSPYNGGAHPPNGFPLATAPPPRPSTPDQPKALGPPGSGENTEAAAADLMLYLAQSPSPVQTRTRQATLGGEGAGMGIKGRRLFSAAGGGGGPPGEGEQASVFGGELDAFQHQHPSPPSGSAPFATASAVASGLDAPFDPSAPSASSSAASSRAASSLPPALPVDPSKPLSHPHSHSQHYPSSSLSLGIGPSPPPTSFSTSTSTSTSTSAAAPGTPRSATGHQRLPSLSGAGWESFINASPSPTRATIPRGETPPRGAGSGSGTGGEGAAAAAW